MSDANKEVAGPKRPRSDGSYLTSRGSKRRKTSIGHGDGFTEEEQSTLGRAAAILGISVGELIAGTRSCPSITTTETDTNSSISLDSDSLPSEGVVTFNLKMPDFSKRASASGNSNASCLAAASEARPASSGSERSVIPWLSTFPTTSLNDASGLGEMEISDQPWNNNWEVNLLNDPNIWEDLGWRIENTSSPTFHTLTCYDETFISPMIEEGLPMSMLGDPVLNQANSFGTRIKTPRFNGTKSKEALTQGEETLDGVVARSKRRGPFQNSQERQETGLTRKMNACLRCRMQRIRCRPHPQNPAGNCLTCINVTGRTLSRLPCLRYKISDAELIDHDACPRPSWSRRWSKMEIVDIKDWCSSEIKVIHITQDVGGTSYKLSVRKFTPIEGDALERKWMTNGKMQSFKCAPYAIANMKKAGQALIKFADQALDSSICYYIDETDRLIRDTYSMAYRYSLYAEMEDERRLMKCVLRLWCASRMESRSDRICGIETLGMEAQNYGPACPNSGNILLPPVINAQMEIIVTVMILLPMKKAVLQGLQALIQANRSGSWFTIYLCMFILLHSCALLTDADNKKARKQGMQVREIISAFKVSVADEQQQSRFFRSSLIEGLHNGAKVLLGHFHYCNKGSHPFTLDWKSPEVFEKAGLNAEQAQFMQDTSEQIKKKAPTFQKVREEGKFEDELFFLAQLYDRDWKPTHTI